MTITMPADLLAALDERVLAERHLRPGYNITRTDMVRAAIAEAEERYKTLDVKPVAETAN